MPTQDLEKQPATELTRTSPGRTLYRNSTSTDFTFNAALSTAVAANGQKEAEAPEPTPLG